LKVQSKIVRKVAIKRAGIYTPHKFPAPVPGVPTYNVVLAETRGFEGGEKPNAEEVCQLVWGAQHYISQGGQFPYDIDGILLAGLFDKAKSGTEAQLFRERIHILALVNEREFGEDCVIQQTFLFPNVFLQGSTAALTGFPLGKPVP